MGRQHPSIQKLRKMGLLKVLTKNWLALGQDSAKDKKSSQLQAFDALTAEEKAKAFDELTPEDKLEVLDEQLRISERLTSTTFLWRRKRRSAFLRNLSSSLSI